MSAQGIELGRDLDDDVFISRRMAKAHAIRNQRDARGRPLAVCAVARITEDGMARTRELNANLVLAASLERYLQQRSGSVLAEHLVAEPRLFAPGPWTIVRAHEAVVFRHVANELV